MSIRKFSILIHNISTKDNSKISLSVCTFSKFDKVLIDNIMEYIRNTFDSTKARETQKRL